MRSLWGWWPAIYLGVTLSAAILASLAAGDRFGRVAGGAVLAVAVAALVAGFLLI